MPSLRSSVTFTGRRWIPCGRRGVQRLGLDYARRRLLVAEPIGSLGAHQDVRQELVRRSQGASLRLPDSVIPGGGEGQPQVRHQIGVACTGECALRAILLIAHRFDLFPGTARCATVSRGTLAGRQRTRRGFPSGTAIVLPTRRQRGPRPGPVSQAAGATLPIRRTVSLVLAHSRLRGQCVWPSCPFARSASTARSLRAGLPTPPTR